MNTLTNRLIDGLIDCLVDTCIHIWVDIFLKEFIDRKLNWSFETLIVAYSNADLFIIDHHITRIYYDTLLMDRQIYVYARGSAYDVE